jgi:hypothetical protein
MKNQQEEKINTGKKILIDILKNKLKDSEINVPEDALLCLIENTQTNISELLVRLDTVLLSATTNKCEITVDFVEDVLIRYCKKQELIKESSYIDNDNVEVSVKLIKREHPYDLDMEEAIRVFRGNRHIYTIPTEDAIRVSEIILELTKKS